MYKEKEDEFFWGCWADGAAPPQHTEVDLLLMFVWKATLVNPCFLFGH